MRDNGFAPASVTVAGGATRSDLWLQTHADVSNVPFILTKARRKAAGLAVQPPMSAQSSSTCCPRSKTPCIRHCCHTGRGGWDIRTTPRLAHRPSSSPECRCRWRMRRRWAAPSWLRWLRDCTLTCPLPALPWSTRQAPPGPSWLPGLQTVPCPLTRSAALPRPARQPDQSLQIRGAAAGPNLNLRGHNGAISGCRRCRTAW